LQQCRHQKSKNTKKLILIFIIIIIIINITIMIFDKLIAILVSVVMFLPRLVGLGLPDKILSDNSLSDITIPPDTIIGNWSLDGDMVSITKGTESNQYLVTVNAIYPMSDIIYDSSQKHYANDTSAFKLQTVDAGEATSGNYTFSISRQSYDETKTSMEQLVFQNMIGTWAYSNPITGISEQVIINNNNGNLQDASIYNPTPVILIGNPSRNQGFYNSTFVHADGTRGILRKFYFTLGTRTTPNTMFFKIYDNNNNYYSPEIHLTNIAY
jgi:hypothetical protein